MAASRDMRVMRLLPTPAKELPLGGLYLAHDVRAETRTGRAYCYSNFVVSLDGRISVSGSADEPPSGVPRSLASAPDWRLFQELVAQADAVVVSGRYVREVAEGRAQPLIQLQRPDMDDLVTWRSDRGLTPAPDVVVVSSSLDFEPQAAYRVSPRVTAVTGATAPGGPRRALVDAGISVLDAGSGPSVEGGLLAVLLAGLGYANVYVAAGPVVLHMLVTAGVLDQLFVTHVGRLLGGHNYSGLIEGDLLEPPFGLELEALYLDPTGLTGASQFFTVYRSPERATPAPPRDRGSFAAASLPSR